MQIPILSGMATDEAGDFRTALSRNMIPVPKDNAISKGYFRPADGIAEFGTGPGPDRGGINWNGVLYRVMGNSLVSVDSLGAVTVLGTVGGGEQVRLDYSFDVLGIAAGGVLYYWDGATLTSVTDPDIGNVIDVLWVDGYWMTTDGTSLIVTDLNDRYSVNPLKYGSSEVDPDPIKAELKLNDEVYALNRYTVEVFSNIGGNFFPFQRNAGAQFERGSIGTHCCAVFLDQIAFLGGGRNEAPAIWIGINNNTNKISTREIDTLLLDYSEAELAASVMEARVFKSHQLLYLHLPDKTLVYDGAGSQVVQEPVWFELDSGLLDTSMYRARNIVWVYDQWIVGDPTSSSIGKLDDTISTHYGQVIGWEFSTPIIYNGSNGAIFHQLELVALPGRVALGADPVVWTSYSLDGETFSQERPCPAGKQGDRTRRITWLRQGHMRNWRIQKFRGNSDAHLSFARLEAQLEPMNA